MDYQNVMVEIPRESLLLNEDFTLSMKVRKLKIEGKQSKSYLNHKMWLIACFLFEHCQQVSKAI